VLDKDRHNTSERWRDHVIVHGDVAAGFEEVQQAFVANFDQHGDVGAAFTLFVGGTKAVDIWGGVADVKTDREWDRDTLTLVYSASKGITAIVAHLLAQSGELDLDAPVVSYWPEFGAEGKQNVPVRWLLSHRTGLPTLEHRVTLEEALAWEPAVGVLATQHPLWEPGTTYGYHALTYGWLIGEVIRRATGRSLSQILAEDISRPLGLDLWIGLPASEEPRVSRLIAATPPVLDEAALAVIPSDQLQRLRESTDPSSLAFRTLNPTHPPFNFNSPALHAAELGAANAITTARALATLYASTMGEVGGIRILAPATVAAAAKEQSSGTDFVMRTPGRFGTGFQLPIDGSLMGPSSYGHAGAGGSLGFADPETGVAFAYVMNRMQIFLGPDPRTRGLIEAVRRAVS
jgi:CubicO group peptidase (beta-lactamase class C family)